MRLTIKGIEDDKPIPERFAFGIPDPKEHMTFGANMSPDIRWTDFPKDTKSFALVMKDPDVPGDASDANQDGKTIPADLPRVDFFHWLLADIPSGVHFLVEGEDSDEVVAKGKPYGPVEVGVRGVNNFTEFMAGNPDMEGKYGGYDGPCPPWNDERMHHYEFTVYALDVTSLDLPEGFRGQDLLAAMQGHVLDQASITGTYTLNPALR
ncbi:YbhB/YbcL family Raf kinase inhibitor-like protein [Hydrocarboniclastica marina]|uniref:YbhB/YbcL family Raf kinase inhibitor-like protein n=1 Tax=Hydrocarboniclastica marina TaxID=2259620 RepID=A0A4P7XCJ2_9ALTE|nr:YbhB/YbcL family Raf kinase inhibitor-like protein [Hydrocarboniclastica marina]QCF24558.1 YbhB/YbcL family Raf kinase inhibitor-like protein [Hydrocarboniclastica marina]